MSIPLRGHLLVLTECSVDEEPTGLFIYLAKDSFAKLAQAAERFGWALEGDGSLQRIALKGVNVAFLEDVSGVNPENV